ncbi:LacI family DNA-binding transcriptional regulator [Nocardiopsis sp. NPDC058631]|uniref:LacI family DNA-binding transcriptional regulator n=1 Tax=Nocardiopsis sp. NPDC058631 TaxID=3346566 RepID=UPI0036550B57
MDRPEPAGAIGLVLARPRRLLSAEPFFMEFVAGIEERVAARDMAFLLHLVTDTDTEISTYRRWRERHLVDAVVVVNLAEDDPRPAVLRGLGLPAVLAGVQEPDPSGTPTVRADHVSPAGEALTSLLDLGHRRIARVSGPARLLHTRARTDALAEGCRAAGIADPVVLEGDYSHEEGARLTRELLGREQPPTAILYDNDVMAVSGLEAARELGVSVPGEVSMVAWDDSTLCRLASPTLSSVSVDVYRYGTAVGESALECADGLPVAERWSPAATLVARGSTGPAPAP